jgi:aspartate/methionine/tyrosine aminotransferase
VAFVRHLVTEVGVAAVPGSSFFRDAGAGRDLVRFCFCKKDETLAEAGRRLLRRGREGHEGNEGHEEERVVAPTDRA